MARTISYTETLSTTQCWCGIHLAVPDNLLRQALDHGQSIYCPLGHQFSWNETEADRQRKRAERAEARESRRIAELDQANASLRTTKGVVTKLKKRVGKGVCPCCNRHFANVERHMTTQHPEVADG